MTEVRFLQVTMEKEKETKNMVRYAAPGGDEAQHTASIPLVYVRKTHLASAFGGFPEKIKLTVEIA